MKSLYCLTLCFVFTSVATANVHHTVRLKNSPYGPPPKVTVLRISPDGSEVAVGTSRGVHFVDTSTGNINHLYALEAFSLAYSRDGTRIYLVGGRGSALLDTNSKGQIQDNRSPYEWGYVGIAFAKVNGKWLVSYVDPGSPSSQSGQIHVGDELVGVGEGKSGETTKVEYQTLKRILKLIKGAPGTYVRLSIIKKGEIHETVVTLRRQSRRFTDRKHLYLPIPSNPVAENVAWCISGGGHQFRSAQTGLAVSTFRPENIESNRGTRSISPDSGRFAWIGQYERPPADLVAKYKQRALKKPSTSLGGGDAAQVAGSAADTFASGSPRKQFFGAEIFDIGTSQLLATFPIASDGCDGYGPNLLFRGLRFVPHADTLIAGMSTRLDVYDTTNGEKVKEIIPPDAGKRIPRVCSFAAGSHVVAVGDGLGKVQLIDIQSDKVLKTIESREKSWVTHTELSNDEKWLAYVVSGVLHVVDVQDVTKA